MIGSAQAPTPTATHALTIERTFAAPAALVFSLWADAHHLRNWLGPHDFTCTAAELDFRVGGAWRACIVSDEYGESWMGGRYAEIVPGQRLVFTFAWADGRDQPGVETRVTITFEEQRDGRTKQTFHQAPFVHEEARDSHIGGWNQAFDKEQGYGEGIASAEGNGSGKGQPS